MRFDVAPKDMCIAASQEAAHGDSSVVLQQLCSLGSVLAGGKGEATSAASVEEGGGCPDQLSSGEGSNSRGACRESSTGGENLLTRWLQPTATSACGGGQRQTNPDKSKHDGGVGEIMLGDANTPQTTGSTTGSGSGSSSGTRVVNDWAKKALLRKKLADAERGRRFRLQLEEDMCLATTLKSSIAPTKDQAVPPPLPSCPNEALISKPPSKVAVHSATSSVSTTYNTRDKSPPASSLEEKTPQSTASTLSTFAHRDTPGDAAPASGTSNSAAGGTMDGDEDEYGDDFGFLTDADLQALEDKATQTSAACSQQASQPVGRSNAMPQSQPILHQSKSPGGWTGNSRNVGQARPRLDLEREKGSKNFGGRIGPGSVPWKKAEGSGAHNISSMTGPSRRQQQVAGSKRPATTYDRRHLGGPTPPSATQPSRSNSSVCNSTLSQQSTGTSQQGGNRDQQQQLHGSQGRSVPGQKGEGRSSWRTPSNLVTAPRNSSTKAKVGVCNALGEKNAVKAPAGAPNTAEACQPELFTTYKSMADFTNLTAPGGRTGQGIMKMVPDKGQTRLKDWSTQLKQPGVTRTVGARATKGTSSGASEELFAGSAGDFIPALVHRRFLVLEVTYVSKMDGNGTREKVLIVLEEEKNNAMAADTCLDEPLSTEIRGGAIAALQRRISLKGDWYDCEVEPGDVVHVLFPISAEGLDWAPSKANKEKEEEMLASQNVIIDNASGKLLVVQPDILVSPTKVADTVVCTRKAVLQSRLASNASKSKPAVLGNLKHELFESSLLAASAATKLASAPPSQGAAWSNTGHQRLSPAGSAASAWHGYESRGEGGHLLTPQYMANLVDRIVVSQLEALYGCGLDEDSARRELLSVSGPILNWHRSFLSNYNSDTITTTASCKNLTKSGHVRAGGSGGGYSRSTTVSGSAVNAGGEGGFATLGRDSIPAVRVSVSRVLATEDDVWSPMLGLKGIMDATVEADIKPLGQAAHCGGARLPAGTALGGGSLRSLVMPVEIKTGKRIGDANSSHRAQVR